MTNPTKSKQMERLIDNNQGVTLLELVVYLVVAGMLLGTAVTSFMGQNKSYNRQDAIAEIQQNIRGVTEQMSSDIRFAGVGLAETNYKSFAMARKDYFGINLDSDLNEKWEGIDDDDMKTVEYRLDPNSPNIQRGYAVMGSSIAAADWETIAENIDQLRFQYLVERSNWEWEDEITNANDLDLIRAVKIIILGSARDSAFNPTDTTVYKPPLDPTPTVPTPTETWTPLARTGYKRMMSTIVQCRNSGG